MKRNKTSEPIKNRAKNIFFKYLSISSGPRERSYIKDILLDANLFETKLQFIQYIISKAKVLRREKIK